MLESELNKSAESTVSLRIINAKCDDPRPRLKRFENIIEKSNEIFLFILIKSWKII